MEIDLLAIMLVAIPAGVTAVFAYLQGSKSTKVDAYKAMADRVAIVEARADQVHDLVGELAKVRASMTILNSWVHEAAEWMYSAQNQLDVESKLPLPPLPPPKLELSDLRTRYEDYADPE